MVVPHSKGSAILSKRNSQLPRRSKGKLTSRSPSVNVKKSTIIEETGWKTRAPFFVSAKRFLHIGFHPELDPEGHFVIRPLGPGQYHPENADNAFNFKKGSDNECWKRKLQSEEFSKNMGYKNVDILNRRRFDRSSRGPGTHDITEDFSCQCPGVLENVGFGMEARFKIRKSSTPGPGLYGKYHIPHTRLYESKLTKCTKTATMDFAGFGSRFKDPCPNWSLAPNRYNPKDRGDMDALLSKRVSLRGPYNLFTGPRDNSTINNHFAPSTFPGSKTVFYDIPKSLDHLISHPSKRHNGEFLQAARFEGRPTMRMMLADLSLAYRDPDEPGPASYANVAVDTIKKLPEQKYPFGNSKGFVRPGANWTIFPGPGRYSPKKIDCFRKHKGHQNSWMFKSVIRRPEYKYEYFGYIF